MSRGSDAVKLWRKRFRTRLVLSMGGKCVTCGYDKCEKAFDIHHIDPNEKDFSFGERRAHPKRLADLADELMRCALLCKNCHIEVHDGSRPSPAVSSFNPEIFASHVKQEKVKPRGANQYGPFG